MTYRYTIRTKISITFVVTRFVQFKGGSALKVSSSNSFLIYLLVYFFYYSLGTFTITSLIWSSIITLSKIKVFPPGKLLHCTWYWRYHSLSVGVLSVFLLVGFVFLSVWLSEITFLQTLNRRGVICSSLFHHSCARYFP